MLAEYFTFRVPFRQAALGFPVRDAVNTCDGGGQRKLSLDFHVMTRTVASGPLLRCAPRLLAEHAHKRVATFSTRAYQNTSCHAARNRPGSRVHPITPNYGQLRTRHLSQTPIVQQRTPSEESKAGLDSTTGITLDKASQDAERLDATIANTAGVHPSSTPTVPPSPPPTPSQASQAPGSFSATPFTTGSGLFDAFLTTVVGLGMGECGILWFVVYYIPRYPRPLAVQLRLPFSFFSIPRLSRETYLPISFLRHLVV